MSGTTTPTTTTTTNNPTPVATAGAAGGVVGAVVVLLTLGLAHWNITVPAEGAAAAIVVLGPIVHWVALWMQKESPVTTTTTPVTAP